MSSGSATAASRRPRHVGGIRRRPPWPGRALAAALALAGQTWGPAAAEAEPLWQTDDLRVDLGGHVKGFLVGSPTAADGRPLVFTRDRVALEGDVEALRRLRLTLEYRVEAFGSLVGRADLSAIRREATRDVVDLEWRLVDERDLLVRHFLHRAVATLDVAPLRVAVGRQRIAWGTGKLWSPTDLFNPLDTLGLERSERRGADAALATLALAPQADLTGVYAPLRDAPRGAGRLHATVRGVDVSGLAGARSGEAFVGADFASPLGQGLVRGEALATFPEDGRVVVQAVLAGEYTFRNSLGVVMEYFRNGAGKTRAAGYEVDRLVAGDILALGRDFLGLILSYDLTPLLRAEVAVAQSLTDGSTYVNPRLIYGITANAEVALGSAITRGAERSEFGRLPDLYYVELRWTF